MIVMYITIESRLETMRREVENIINHSHMIWSVIEDRRGIVGLWKERKFQIEVVTMIDLGIKVVIKSDQTAIKIELRFVWIKIIDLGIRIDQLIKTVTKRIDLEIKFVIKIDLEIKTAIKSDPSRTKAVIKID
jgi:hypothetical protein